MSDRRRGFTLMELLIVVAIIGIIAAIAIPSLLIAIQRSKQRRTMVDMRSIATAWEARNTEQGRYNAAGAIDIDGADQDVDINLLALELSPTYMKTVPRVDAWGQDYVLSSDKAWGASAAGQRYAIVSIAKDGVQADPPIFGPLTNYDCDIIYSDGTFLAYPEGGLTKQ